MESVLTKDIKQFTTSFPFRQKIHGSYVLVTGATGLLGSTLIRCLLAINEDIHIIAPIRDKEKLQRILGDTLDAIISIECDLETFNYSVIPSIDYIFHCAAPTSSSFFVNHPVETARSIWQITDHLLQYAHSHQIKGMVYLSSLEVYGSGLNEEMISEEQQGYWNVTDVRSSYPIAKRAAENLCHAYAKQYTIPVKIARLTQTTGAGVDILDNRVINQFARLAAQQQDIVLHSTGESARPYCYTIDCIMALMYILFNGVDGEAYNVANKATYISAIELAEYIRDHFATNIQVKILLKENMGYAPVSKLRLATDKLETLGWKSQYGLDEILCNLINYFRESE